LYLCCCFGVHSFQGTFSAMPKKDAFGDAKKEAEKGRKKMLDAQKKEAKVAKDEAAREVTEVVGGSTSVSSSAKAGGKNTLKASNGTFAKAQQVEARDNDEEEEAAVAEDYDYDEDVAETTAATASASKAKPTKEDLKKSKKQLKKDEFSLLDEQKSLAKKERIKDRFLKVLIVGVIMDVMNGKDSNGHNGKKAEGKKAPASKDTKKAKKSQDDGEGITARSIKEKIDLLWGPVMIAIVVMAMLYGKAMEDGYSSFDAPAVDYYEVMGVPHDASVMDIRKKYKSLSLTWHPDKNPDCEACPEKFAAISKAYETLKDPEQKKAYDNKKNTKETSNSAVSVDLTAEDFEAKVLRSNEVWYVQVYDSGDSHHSSFHPIWEEIGATHEKVASFGRIDVSKQKKALDYFPQRVPIMPVVFRFARGQTPELWKPDRRSEGEASSPLSRFVVESFPQLNKVDTLDDLTTWWKASDRSRLLISGNSGVIRRGAQNKEFFKVLREAHMWADYFAITSADAKDATQALKAFDVELPGPGKKKGLPWSVIYIPAGQTNAKVQIASTEDLKELPAKIEEVVQKAMSAEAPHLTVRNHRQLCGAGTASRTFCLILVDMTSPQQITKVLEEVAASRADYSKELAEVREGESDTAPEEEPFRIQTVRVMTGTSRFPSEPVAVSRDFYTAWAEVGHAPMFLVELETQRVAAVKDSVVAQLCQQIAYEDLKLKELPENFHLLRALPDPEVPLRRAIFRIISSPIGAMVTYLLLAVVIAVAPELTLPANMAALGGFLVLVVLVWPLGCRRLLSLGSRV